MENKKLGVAIIGCGNISGSHIPNYLKMDNVEVRYFCDIIPERADAAVEKYGCGKAVYSHKELLGHDDIDLVSICTHNDTHAPISIDFMKDGKDVLCEKPAARTLEEALEMQKVAHETGRMLSIGVVNRFVDAVNEIKKLIADGTLGEVYQVYISFRNYRSIPGLGGDFTTKAVSGGGVLIDWGVHFIDLVLYCLGEPTPLTCSGVAHSKLGTPMKDYVYKSMWALDTKNTETGTFDVDDFVTGLIRTDGPTITLNGAWAQNIKDKEMFVDFIGTKGGVRMEYGGMFKLYSTMGDMLTEITPDFNSKGFNYGGEIEDFVESVITRKPNRAYIDNAVVTSRIMDALYRSSESGKEVTL